MESLLYWVPVSLVTLLAQVISRIDSCSPTKILMCTKTWRILVLFRVDRHSTG